MALANIGIERLPADYTKSAAHYEAVARRILVALRRDCRSFALVTGDPPANPQPLCDALVKVAGWEHATIIISCGPELRGEDVERAAPAPAKPNSNGRVETEDGYSAPALPLLVFDNFDRLSDRQIETLSEGMSRGNGDQRRAILLARCDFLTRLAHPALRSLRDNVAIQFQFQEIDNEEAIAILHSQLFSQRDRRVEARGFRRGVLIGLAVSAVTIAATTGAFILHSTAERLSRAPANTETGSSVNQEVAMLSPAEEEATNPPRTSGAANTEANSEITTPPPLSTPAPAPENDPLPMAIPSPAEMPAGSRLSETEITALLARGQSFLSAGDVTSARGFYERAAEAQSGLAALLLGATFDPAFSGRAGDPVQALFWYRRARELGAGGAEQRIQALGLGSIPAQDMDDSRTGKAEEQGRGPSELRLNPGPVPIEPTIAPTVDQPQGKSLSVEVPGPVPTAIGKAASVPSSERPAPPAAGRRGPVQARHPFSFRKRPAQQLASTRLPPVHAPTRAIEDVLRKHPHLLK